MNRAARFALFIALLLAAANASQLLAQSSADPTFYLGTLQDRNTADPRPAESTYFRTQRGGFVVRQGYAGYLVEIEVIKKPRRTLYTRAILQNPLDPLIPFVYEHFIDGGTGSTILGHGPVMGLKLDETYTVELILYQDKDRKKEIDRLTQPVRSYVDTSGPTLKVSDQLALKSLAKREVPERWKFTFDSRSWQLGHQNTDDMASLREYVLQGETVENWSELVSSLLLTTDMAPRALVAVFNERGSKDCPSYRSATLEESATDILFEWRHKGCRGYPAQHELKRITRVERGLLVLSYVMKTEQLPDEKRSAWLAILRAATPSP